MDAQHAAQQDVFECMRRKDVARSEVALADVGAALDQVAKIFPYLSNVLRSCFELAHTLNGEEESTLKYERDWCLGHVRLAGLDSQTFIGSLCGCAHWAIVAHYACAFHGNSTRPEDICGPVPTFYPEDVQGPMPAYSPTRALPDPAPTVEPLALYNSAH